MMFNFHMCGFGDKSASGRAATKTTFLLKTALTEKLYTLDTTVSMLAAT
jgi:hypothetical protein